MGFVVAALIVLGALVLLNLALTAAVIRKLRRQQDAPPGGLPVGSVVGDFDAAGVDGVPVSAERLRDTESLYGFFSSDCAGCLPKVPAFLAAAGRARTRGIVPVAVITVIDQPADELLAALGDGLTVVVEQGRGVVGKAFGIGAFPWFVRVAPDGTVAAASADPDACVDTLARV